MEENRFNISSQAVELDNDQIYILGDRGSRIYSVDILRTSDLMEALAYFRRTLKISFGIGPYDTLYMLGDDIRPAHDMSFNLPLNVTYNEYKREINVTEFFPEAKIQALNKLTNKRLSEEPQDELESIVSSSENPYFDLKNWVLNEENGSHEKFEKLSHAYLDVTHNFKFDGNVYRTSL